MKALSIKQPWAWLICKGFKDIENRTWHTNFLGKVLIHTGKIPDNVPQGEINGISLPGLYNFGGIVGIAEIIACVKDSDSPWFNGPYGFVLKNARPLPFMPCRGQLGFFEVDYHEGRPKVF